MQFQGWLCEGCNVRFGDEGMARAHEAACTRAAEKARAAAEHKAWERAEEARLGPIAEQIRALYEAESDEPGPANWMGAAYSPRQMLARMVNYCGGCGNEDCQGHCRY